MLIEQRDVFFWETKQDLYNFQNELSRVDGLRVDGKVRLHLFSLSLSSGRVCADN